MGTVRPILPILFTNIRYFSFVIDTKLNPFKITFSTLSSNIFHFLIVLKIFKIVQNACGTNAEKLCPININFILHSILSEFKYIANNWPIRVEFARGKLINVTPRRFPE